MEKACVNRAGYSHGGLIWSVTTLLLALLLSVHFASAQGTGAAGPEPAPTDAVKVSGKTLVVEGTAELRQGHGSARYAALLRGYGKLLRYGLRNGMFPGGWGSQDSGYRFYRIDADHPASDVLSWIARSKVTDEKNQKGEKVLTLESPAVGTLASAQPFLRSMTTQDVDLDGLSDVIAVGYDGRVYVLQSPGQSESKVKARSESFALLELVTGPGYERIRAVLPLGLESVERVGDEQLRVLMKFETLEVVNGELQGRLEEQRELLISMSDTMKRIRFTINEPTDFARLHQESVEIRGSAISEKLLEDVHVRLNGKLAWESPSGIGIRALQFNLAQKLSSGWNSIRITARDQDGFSQMREIWVEGSSAETAAEKGKKRAILFALDNKFKQERIHRALVDAGFHEAWITIVEGDDATGEGFLASLRQSLGATELLFYCEATSLPGALVEGKALRFEDREVSPTDIAQAIQAGGYEKTLGLFHTEVLPARRNQFTAFELWRDTAAFLDRLGDAGRLVIANTEAPNEGTRSMRRRSRERLLEALEANSGSDLERVIDRKSPEHTLFRGWMHGAPIF